MPNEKINYRAMCDHSSHDDLWQGSVRTSNEEAGKDADKHNRDNDGHNASVEIIYPKPKNPTD